ncbi:MAG: helicase C-terminal domain-containing protein [Verrucomicrobiota bacterium]
MHYDLDQRTATLGIGEFSTFATGPRDDTGGGHAGLWRAQLGSHWHRELQLRATETEPAATFEVPIEGKIVHAGWIISLAGRMDQYLPGPAASLIREIKTTLRPLPRAEDELRAEHPDYVVQLATYLALHRIDRPDHPVNGELVFVEAGSGLSQTIRLTRDDDHLFRARLDRLTAFLDLRLAARERLRGLRFQPPFATLRPGQETTRADLTANLATHDRILFTAPTGFGKTGVLLECALEHLRAGRAHRLVYLTGKATGQLQVTRTLAAMTTPAQSNHNGYFDRNTPDSSEMRGVQNGVATWVMRPKKEHCINATFHCTRDACGYLHDIEGRWERAGLGRFLHFQNHARDLPALLAAGKNARVCPYEITRTALAFQDVWVGDYNYVFAPANRRIFFEQPGWEPADTLLVIDEAHNLPQRVADAHSHQVNATDAQTVLAELDHHDVSTDLLRAWDTWTRLLANLGACDELDLMLEDDVHDAVRTVADRLAGAALDPAALGPFVCEQLWRLPVLAEWLARADLPRLLWSPRSGELHFTCLDASAAIAETLAPFGAVVFATATPGPAGAFAAACGFDAETPPRPLDAHTPWRADAYSVGYDVRVDTSYQKRERHHGDTADAVAELHAAARGPVAVFFPSYAYAEAIERALQARHPAMRVARQPRQSGLAAQTDWMETALAFNDALFLVLGSSFAEGIDGLGGRIGHAIVVGPALPEVNAVQRAKQSAMRGESREEAFRRVYQIPGLQKVNQALGRLVRAPGQHAKVLLHCRRFVEPAYAALLAPEYQFGETIATDGDLAAWLAS